MTGVLLCLLPESPYFLLLKGEETKAQKSLNWLWLNSKEHVGREMQEIKEAIKREKSREEMDLLHLFTRKKHRR